MDVDLLVEQVRAQALERGIDPKRHKERLEDLIAEVIHAAREGERPKIVKPTMTKPTMTKPTPAESVNQVQFRARIDGGRSLDRRARAEC